MAVASWFFPGMLGAHAGPPMRFPPPLLFPFAASLLAHALLLSQPGGGGRGALSLPVPARPLHAHIAAAGRVAPARVVPSSITPVAPAVERKARGGREVPGPGLAEANVDAATAAPPAVPAPPPETSTLASPAGPTELNYLSPEDVDRRATVIEAQPLPLPPAGSPLGRLQAKLFVNAQGEVEDMEVEANALTPEYGEALRQYFPSMHFRPAEKDGRPTASWIRMEFVYEDAPPPAP